MTKEEILDEYGCPDIPFDEKVTMYYPAILEAMEEYAKQQIQKCSVLTENQEQSEQLVCDCGNKLTNKEIYFGQCLQCDKSVEE